MEVLIPLILGMLLAGALNPKVDTHHHHPEYDDRGHIHPHTRGDNQHQERPIDP